MTQLHRLTAAIAALFAVLLFATCSTATASQHMGIIPKDSAERLQFGEAGILLLRGPSGQILDLQGSGPKRLAWTPTDKRALEVELRVFIAEWVPPTGFAGASLATPLVRWGLSYGHGKNTYNTPPIVAQLGGASPGSITALPYVLPARGLVQRMAARELQIELYQVGWWESQNNFFAQPEPPKPTSCKVAVSFLPIIGSEVAQVPRQNLLRTYSDSFLSDRGPTRNPLPAEATEMRIFNALGQPYVLGDANDQQFAFLSLSGQNLVGFSGGAVVPRLSTFATFQPIPLAAAYCLYVNEPREDEMSPGVEFR